MLLPHEVRFERRGLVAAWSWGGAALDDAISVLAAPRETLKRSSKNWTYRAGAWAVKETCFRYGAGLFKHTFRRGHYRRAWEAACYLTAKGIPTPEPLAYLEFGACGLIWRNALIVRHLEGFQRTDHYVERLVARGAHDAEIASFFDSLAAAIGALADAGAYHSDLTGKNVLTKDGASFQFIDLDAVYLNVPYTREKRMRNHVQLYDTFLEWLPDEMLASFIARLAPPDADADAWIQEVRELRRVRRERAEALWRKYGRPENV